MSDARLELASIPAVYNIRHHPPRLKRSRVDLMYEECVVRVASWNADQAPLVATLKPGNTIDDPRVWQRIYPDTPMEQGLPTIAYRAARGADGTVRLVSPVRGHAFVDRFGGQPDMLLGMSRIARMSLPGSDHSNTPQPAHQVQVGHIISSERGDAVEYSRHLAQSMVLVDGQLYMSCGEPGWRYSTTARGTGLYADSNVLDTGSMGWDDFVPYGMSDALATQIPSEISRLHEAAECTRYGHLDIACPNILGGDPAWSMLQIIVYKAIYAQAEVVLGMSGRELELRMELAATIRDWPSFRDPAIVAQASRLVRVVYSIMPTNHENTMKSMLALEAGMARTPGMDNLEHRLAAQGMHVGLDQGAASPIIR